MSLPTVTDFSVIFFTLIALAALAFITAKRRSNKQRAGGVKPHSVARYYGLYAAVWTFVPAFVLLLICTLAAPHFIDALAKAWLAEAFPLDAENFLNLKNAQLRNIASGLIASPDAVMTSLALSYSQALDHAENLRLGLVILLAVGGATVALIKIKPALTARIKIERFLRWTFFLAATIAVITTTGIVMSLLFESLRFFAQYNPIDFFFGTHWSPLAAFNSGLVESIGDDKGSFGMVPVMTGTLLVALVAMAVAVPVGLFAAIYMAEFAPRPVRNTVKPILEILAGIPTVVYGFFAALTAGPFIRDLGLMAGLDVSAQSALAAGGVMGIMIIPFISSLSDDVITAVPQSLRDGALAVGSTHGETITRVVLPAAFPGLVSAFLLAISRAIGETMIVVMAAGVSANLTANPLDSVTTVTVQIVMLLTGDTEFDSIKTLSAFALGITLFFATLLLNVAALGVARKIGERYD